MQPKILLTVGQPKRSAKEHGSLVPISTANCIPESRLGYGIGQAQPVGLRVETFGTDRLSDEEIKRRLLATCDVHPAAILARHGLRYLPRELGRPF